MIGFLSIRKSSSAAMITSYFLSSFQLYNIAKVQLCVVATNLNQRDVQYFHPKTTPNLPIHIAIELSMSTQGNVPVTLTNINLKSTFHIYNYCKWIDYIYLNGLIALKYHQGELVIPSMSELSKKQSLLSRQGVSPDSMQDLFIQGSLTCNYPLHAFDGKVLIRIFLS